MPGPPRCRCLGPTNRHFCKVTILCVHSLPPPKESCTHALSAVPPCSQKSLLHPQLARSPHSRFLLRLDPWRGTQKTGTWPDAPKHPFITASKAGPAVPAGTLVSGSSLPPPARAEQRGFKGAASGAPAVSHTALLCPCHAFRCILALRNDGYRTERARRGFGNWSAPAGGCHLHRLPRPPEGSAAGAGQLLSSCHQPPVFGAVAECIWTWVRSGALPVTQEVGSRGAAREVTVTPEAGLQSVLRRRQMETCPGLEE